MSEPLHVAFSTKDGLRGLEIPEDNRKPLASANLPKNMMKRLKKRTKLVWVIPNRTSSTRLIGPKLIDFTRVN